MNKQKAKSFIGGYDAIDNGIACPREMGDWPIQLCDRVPAAAGEVAFEVNSSLLVPVLVAQAPIIQCALCMYRRTPTCIAY